jgi:SAM-dependent methyltransferase
MDGMTEQIRQMYTLYPYPSYSVAQIERQLAYLRGNNLRLVSTRDELQLATGNPVGGGLRILNAGCGTAEQHLLRVINEPENEFTFLDVTPASLDKVKGYVKHFGLANIQVLEGDLMNLDGALGEEYGGYFDYVISTGVLHHLPEPAAGLRALKTKMRPGGIMHLMVYARHGRYEIGLMQRAIDIIESNRTLVEERADIFVDLFFGLLRSKNKTRILECNPTIRRLSDEQHMKRGEIVDTFLHVNENVYGVEEVHALVESADLTFLEFIDEPVWDLRFYNVYRERLRERLDGLSRLQKYCLVELLNGYKRMHAFYCADKRCPIQVPCMDEIDRCLIYSRRTADILDTGGRVKGAEALYSVHPYDHMEREYMRYAIPLNSVARDIVLECTDGSTYDDLARLLNTRHGVEEHAVRRTVARLLGRRVLYLVRGEAQGQCPA